jgi:hypothetical protein
MPQNDDSSPMDPQVRGARLEPVGTVLRELTRPDGSKLEVEVPVYPPFRLESEEQAPKRGGGARGKGSAS